MEPNPIDSKKDGRVNNGPELKYKTPEDLQRVIDSYFEATPFDEYTGTGMALVVGSKQLVQDYEAREGYREVIRRAKLRIESSYEMALRKVGGAGNIFALKNYGWTDQQHIDHTTNGRDINSPSGLAQIQALAAKLGDNLEESDEDQSDTTGGA